MSPRRSERIRGKPKRPVHNGTITNTGPKSRTIARDATTLVSARKGRGGAKRGIQANTSNSNQDIVTDNTTAHTIAGNETNEIEQIATANEMSSRDLAAALDTTREDFLSHIKMVTGVLCALFSFLTPPQINEIEKSYENELKDNEIFTKCMNQAKSTTEIKGSAYRDALINESKRNIPKTSEALPQRNAQQRNEAAQPIAQNARNQANGVGTNQSGTHVEVTQRSSGGSSPPAPQPPPPMQTRPRWLQELDNNRSKNIILMGINDTNNKFDDEYIVNEVLKTIGCGHRISQKTYISRLGPKRRGKNRLVIVCFTNENAASEILNRSPGLHRNVFYGQIYIKKDLPRNQRPAYKKSSDSFLSEAAMGSQTSSSPTSSTPQRRQNLNNRAMYANTSNIESESDYSDCDSDSDDNSDGWQTLDELDDDEEDANVSVSDGSETGSVSVSDGSESEADSENETTDTVAAPAQSEMTSARLETRAEIGLVQAGRETGRENEDVSMREATGTAATPAQNEVAAGRALPISNIVPSQPEDGGGDADMSQRIDTLLQEVREQQTPLAGVREDGNNVLPAGNGEVQGGELPG